MSTDSVGFDHAARVAYTPAPQYALLRRGRWATSEGIVRTPLARLESWIAAVAADPAAMLFAVAIILLVVLLLGVALAARRRPRDDHRETVGPAPEGPDQVAIA